MMPMKFYACYILTFLHLFKLFQDSVAFADKFISETPIKQGVMSMQDMVLAERVLAQVIIQHLFLTYKYVLTILIIFA